MLYRGHRYVRLSTKLARALGMSYRAMWNQLQNDDSGFEVMRIPTRQPQKRLMYIRLADINRALGYPLYDPPTLADHGLRGGGSVDARERQDAKETDHADHPKT